jgi:type I restriction enzyme, S subunit
VDEVTGTVAHPEIRPLGDVKKKSYRTFAPGDVLFAKITPCMENGKSAVVPEIGSGLGFGSTEFHVLRPRQDVDPRFIWHFIRQERFRRTAEEHMSGSVGQLRVPAAFLESFPIVIPDTESQAKIVQLLDKADAASRGARTRIDSARRVIERFRQVVLAAACSGRPGDGAEWRRVILREIVDSLDQGWSPQCENRPVVADGEWGVIKTTSVQPMNFLAAENKALPAHLTPRESLEVLAGDLLITRAGPRSRVGVSCFVEETPKRLMICDKVYRIRTRERDVLPSFLEIVLNAPSTVRTLDEMKTGTSESGMNLTQGRFLDMEVTLPDITEQSQIVGRVRQLFMSAGLIEERIDTAGRRVDRTFQEVLAKAFRGGLEFADAPAEPPHAESGSISEAMPV